MRIFIVYADTYQDGWGAEFTHFLTTGDEMEAEKMAEHIRSVGFYPYIKETVLGEVRKMYLGGYIE